MYNKYQQIQNEIDTSVCKWILVEKMHNIFVGTIKASGAPKAYNDGNQVAPKVTSIQNLVDINENVAHDIFKSFQDQQIFYGSILKVFKDLNIQLIATCKKTKIDGKPNKKHNKSNINDFLTLAIAFSQFEESSSIIKIIKIEMHL